MSKFEETLEYVRENPKASYEEITRDVGLSYNVAKTYVDRLKKKGYLEKVGLEYKVLKDMPVNKSSYKSEIIREMVESYMDDFRENKTINEKIRLGELIIRLVDKM